MSLVFSLDLNLPRSAEEAPGDEIVLPGTSNRTVILIHGLTGSPNEMRHLAFTLNKAGYGVHCPRLANHGKPLHILKHSTWEDFYAPLRDLFLRLTGTGERVFVAGLSMSALFVLLLAEEFGEKLAGGICLSPTLFFDGWSVPWYHRLLPLASYTPLKYNLYFKESDPYGIKNPAIRAMVDRHYRKATLSDMGDVSKFGYPYFPVSLIHQLARLIRRVRPLLDRVRAPILLIHPRDDDTASVRNSQIILDRISSPIKELVILTDSYHIITADNEREKVAADMQAFLDRL